MRTSLLTRNTLLAGASVLAFCTLASAGFAQDGGDVVVEPEGVVVDDSAVVDDPTGWVDGEAGLPEEGIVDPEGEDIPIDGEPGLIDEPIDWIDTGVIEDGQEIVGDEDVPVYEEYPVIDGEIILVLEPDYSDSDCGGCEFYTMGGGAGAVDQGSSGGSGRISVAPQTIDMCLTEAWKNLWICRIQAVAAQH